MAALTSWLNVWIADLELQRARRELRDDFAQRFGQPVGNHFKMEKMAGLIALEERIREWLC